MRSQTDTHDKTPHLACCLKLAIYNLPASQFIHWVQHFFSHIQQIPHNKHESLEKDWSRAAIGGRQKFHHSAGQWGDDEQGSTDDVAGGDSDPPVPAIGAATAFTTTDVPSLRPCGDDAPALLPGSLPVSPLCILFFGLHSVTTMSDGQVLITPLSLYSQYIHMLFPRLYRLVYIYDMYHTTYRWPSGELLFYPSSPDDAPSWSQG
jgi:hypothetical protein